MRAENVPWKETVIEYVTWSREGAARGRKGTNWCVGRVMGEGIERERNKFKVCNKI